MIKLLVLDKYKRVPKKMVVRFFIFASILTALSSSCLAQTTEIGRIENLERQLTILGQKLEQLMDMKDLKDTNAPSDHSVAEEIDSTTNDNETRLSDLEETIKALINKIEILEKKMEDTEKFLESVISKFHSLNQKIVELESKIDKLQLNQTHSKKTKN